jgi:uncharacterized protein (DUF3084 family)
MTDRQALISAALGVGAICATVAGSSCSTNARIDDLHANLIDFRAAVRSEFQSVRGEIQSVRDEVEGVRVEIRDVRAELRDVRDDVQGVRGLLIDHLDGHDRGGPGE